MKSRAAALARVVLCDAMPTRYQHVAGVAGRVEVTCARLGLDDSDVVAAAWLHDVGYAEEAQSTGFHALDGAIYAREQGFTSGVTRLIAHHSCARVEAELRGLLVDLTREFPFPDRRLANILDAADMSVGPGGSAMSIDERLADIRQRYAPSDVVNRFLDEAEPELRRVVAEVEGWLLNPSTALSALR